MRRLVALSLTPLLAVGCAYWDAVPPAQRRAFVVSFDGGGARVFSELRALGVMPNLDALVAEGVTPSYARTNFPSKTAAGHASLWTGTYADRHGITSNKVLKLPLAAHSILEVTDGFDGNELLAEPLWVTAAKAGKRVTVLHATHLAPLANYAPGGRFGGPYAGSLRLMDGYGGIWGKEATFQDTKAWRSIAGGPGLGARGQTIPVGKSTWQVLSYDDPADPQVGYDTVALSPRKDAPAFLLKAGRGAASWAVANDVATDKGPATVSFHLADLAADGSSWLLYATPPTQVQTNVPIFSAQFFNPQRPFVPQGAHKLMSAGDLGKTLFQGGDGTAEARYLDTVDHLLDQDTERIRQLFALRDWDLALSYVTYPDEALHLWYGVVDRNSPSYDPVLAPKVWPLLAHVGRKVDAYIGALRGHRGTVLALGADHGMAGLSWRAYPNTLLRKAGLLVLDAKGQVDLSRTRAMYPATDGAFVVVNHTGHRGGIVPPGDVDHVLNLVEAALRPQRTPEGKPLYSGFWRPEKARDMGLGGVRGGDMYLDLPPGYYFSSDFAQAEATGAMKPSQGGHVFDPRRADMHAAMFFAGPGLKRGAAIGPVRTIDLAPTVSHLLGIPAPAHATGRVLEEALAP